MTGYRLDIEICEGKGGRLHKDGDTIIYPDIVKEVI
jgi:hypothetical protein